MTPTLAVLAADPLDDLRALLERVREQREGVLGVEPGLISGGEADWTPAAELAREPYDTLDTWIDATARRWGAPRHVGAALLWKAYAYWHAMPMALGWALNRRVPIMPFDRTVARESPAGVTVAATSITVAVLPDDPYAGRPGTVTVPDLGAAVREALLAGQGPLIDALTRLTASERARCGDPPPRRWYSRCTDSPTSCPAIPPSTPRRSSTPSAGRYATW